MVESIFAPLLAVVVAHWEAWLIPVAIGLVLLGCVAGASHATKAAGVDRRAARRARAFGWSMVVAAAVVVTCAALGTVTLFAWKGLVS